MSAGGLDWPGLMRAGLGPPSAGGLGLLPREFWALTPAELALMLGVAKAPGAMNRDRLAELAERFPDAPRSGPALTQAGDNLEEKDGKQGRI